MLDLPEVRDSARLEAASQLGDSESLHRLQERCEDARTHPAGWSALLAANLRPTADGQRPACSALRGGYPLPWPLSIQQDLLSQLPQVVRRAPDFPSAEPRACDLDHAMLVVPLHTLVADGVRETRRWGGDWSFFVGPGASRRVPVITRQTRELQASPGNVNPCCAMVQFF